MIVDIFITNYRIVYIFDESKRNKYKKNKFS